MSRRNIDQTQGVVRATTRVVWLAFEIVRGALLASLSPQRGEGLRVRGGGTECVMSGRTRNHVPTPHPYPLPVEGRGRRNRAFWLHQVCRRALRIFAVKVNISGKVPSSGLLVANHLSYLDILLLSSLRPCVFVAKSEVRAWPIFGWFARMAGTIFVNRSNRRDTARASEAIRAALRNGVLVVLFPEGTSSNGAMVLPFKSSLLEGVIGERVPVSVGALRYKVRDGNAAQEVCYWGEHTLVPHLLNLMSKRAVDAAISFSSVPNTWRDRKKLATELHAEVTQLHARLGDHPVAVEATRLTSTHHAVAPKVRTHRPLQELRA